MSKETGYKLLKKQSDENFKKWGEYMKRAQIAEAENKVLKEKLKKTEEILRSIYIDCPMGWDLDNPQSVNYEIAIGWHKSNNEKIEQYFKGAKNEA